MNLLDATVKSVTHKLSLTTERREKAAVRLEALCLELNETRDYFGQQWARQKSCQLELMLNGNIVRLEHVFEELQGKEAEKYECE